MTPRPDLAEIERLARVVSAMPSETVLAILARIRELEAALEPRPMASAPKDCEIMLFARNAWHVGRWDSDQYAAKPKPYWNYSYVWRKTGCRAEPPTAWLPLPPPKEPATRPSRS